MNSPDRGQDKYGSAGINPEEDVEAGSVGTWVITYTVGIYGIDDGGTIIVATKMAGDWGRPQVSDPTAPEYLTVSTTGKASLSVRFDSKARVRPWKSGVVIDVYDGYLAPGDVVTITYGDTSGGSPGSTAQSNVAQKVEFRVFVDCFATGQFVQVPGSPTLRVVSGTAHRLVVVCPSEATLGAPMRILVKAEDKWGNPASSYRGAIALSCPDHSASLPATWSFTTEDAGFHWFEGVRLAAAGVHEIMAKDAGNDFVATSNPIVCRDRSPDCKLFWGDIHGQTETTVGTGTPEQYFRFARDIGAVDFAAHCANAFQVTREHYADTQRRVKEFHQPGRYVTFLAYEWSGNTCAGGDHNVYFLGDDEPIHRCSHWQVADKSDTDTDRYPLSELFATFRGRNDVMIIPHVGGRYANLDFYDPAFSPVVEIASTHGFFEWLGQDAIRRGLKIGFVASSDDHTGRPGATYPAGHVFGVRGGLVAVFARQLTRQGVWEALKSRRCYATTGDRIVLGASACGHTMGEEYATDRPPNLTVQVLGTDNLEKVEIVRDCKTIYSHPLGDPGPRNRFKIYWSGARAKGRNRHTNWNGGLSLDKGKITGIQQVAFDNPSQGVYERTENSLKWLSRTSGNHNGVILDLDAPDDAATTFDTRPVKFTLPISLISDEPTIFEGGGVEQQVSVSRAGEPGPKRVEFEFVDESVEDGAHAYYVRVTQRNGGMAWSSPIYVTLRR
ncbi:MAG: DUF3604 domain-containing protein [Chloroflexi bacterium]|nr:DUF3604 domain-containing protein [Chloroflexota bacterium]